MAFFILSIFIYFIMNFQLGNSLSFSSFIFSLKEWINYIFLCFNEAFQDDLPFLFSFFLEDNFFINYLTEWKNFFAALIYRFKYFKLIIVFFLIFNLNFLIF